MKPIRLLAAAIAFAVSASAAADTITVNWKNPIFAPPGAQNVGTVAFPGGSSGTDAGRFRGTVTGTTGISATELYSSAADFYAYCHDLSETLASTTYQVSYGASAVMLDFLGAVNSILGGGVYAWLNPGTSTIAAAVQVGIWEALFNDDFNVTGGLVTFSAVPAAVTAQLNAFVGAMAGASSLSADYVMVLTSTDSPGANNGIQDVITGRRPPIRVPEPGTMALVGLAAVAALTGRRRRR